MELYLIRHGIAIDHFHPSVHSDEERYLTDDGKKELKHIAASLHKMKIVPDAILASPLVRTVQTAQVVAKVLSCEDRVKQAPSLAPGGLIGDIYKDIARLGHVEKVFLIGHEPGMERMAKQFLWAGEEVNMPFKKASVCRIDVFDVPPTSPGVLKWFATPKLLKLISHN